MDKDKFFKIMGNKIRRQILDSLRRGPMSMKQLNGLIDVSRQAILKQLKAMEEEGLIKTIEKEPPGRESRPGPKPHVYSLRYFYTFYYELGPSFAKPRVMQIKILPTQQQEKKALPEIEGKIDFTACIDELIEIEQEITDLVQKQKTVFQRKNKLVTTVFNRIEQHVDNEEEREVLYYILSNPHKAKEGITIHTIASFLGIRDDFAKTVMDNLISIGIMKEKTKDIYILA
ncbi:helix-turn-helix domain-containing protein [Candidatus Bathyarchaeota archaeon]|nr:helix-turn-helix domain-containing protein [Candidatus Bathyarchaeota archaeon]